MYEMWGQLFFSLFIELAVKRYLSYLRSPTHWLWGHLVSSLRQLLEDSWFTWGPLCTGCGDSCSSASPLRQLLEDSGFTWGPLCTGCGDSCPLASLQRQLLEDSGFTWGPLCTGCGDSCSSASPLRQLLEDSGFTWGLLCTGCEDSCSSASPLRQLLEAGPEASLVPPVTRSRTSWSRMSSLIVQKYFRT